jgi:hypothetical protein
LSDLGRKKETTDAMSSDEQPMIGVPVSAEEAERRRGMLAAFYASQTLPALYRLSTMDPDVTWGTAMYGSPTTSQTRFVYEADLAETPRHEVHTLEFGAVEEIAIVPWSDNFQSLPPDVPAQPSTIPVTLDLSSHTGRVLAETSDGWMVSVEAPIGTFLIIGPGDLPSTLSLVRTEIGTPAP